MDGVLSERLVRSQHCMPKFNETMANGESKRLGHRDVERLQLDLSDCTNDGAFVGGGAVVGGDNR